MDPQRSPPAPRQDLEVAAGLDFFDQPEAVTVPGHGQLDGVLTGDLEEYPCVGAAFVGLAGRVLEARPEPDASGHPAGVSNLGPDLGQDGLVRGGHLHVGE